MIGDARQTADDTAISLALGTNKGYDAREFIETVREMDVTPHVARNTSGRSSAVPEAMAQSEGYILSQQKRKLTEQGFGWPRRWATFVKFWAWIEESRSVVCADHGWP
jgi:hypothetical protein